LCSFEGPRRRGLDKFPVALAWGKHLFPFRTEPLSPTAPMVLGLHGPGRVGRRRSFESRAALWRLVRVPATIGSTRAPNVNHSRSAAGRGWQNGSKWSCFANRAPLRRGVVDVCASRRRRGGRHGSPMLPAASRGRHGSPMLPAAVVGPPDRALGTSRRRARADPKALGPPWWRPEGDGASDARKRLPGRRARPPRSGAGGRCQPRRAG
jgi:hypothetical protein